MTKTFIILALFAWSTISVAQQFGPAPQNVVGKVYLSGQIVGAAEQSIAFGNQNKGGVRSPMATFKTDKDGKFTFEHELPFPDYYYLKFENNQLLNLILHGNDTIKIYGDMKNILELSNFVGSEESEAMNQFLVAYTSFKQMEDSLKTVVHFNPQKGAEVNAYFQPLAEQFYKNRNNFINIYSTSPAIVVAVNAIDVDREWELYQQVVALLQQSYGASPTVKNIVQFVVNKNGELAAKKFLEPGNPAKEIALPNPDGEIMKLSDLKGKVVLIDFWASWCGPCRKENPNVVNMYKKYGEDGFTVYSVSLDHSAEKWKAAIIQDGLTWPNHVSDLKKWQSAAAADYVVKSIPFTVLIDKEGKVIGSNIRGAELQNQLKAIFGH